MIDEEKAEENYTKVYLNGDMSLDTEEKYFAYTKGYCKGHTDGLAEGRKEVTYMTADEYDKTLDKCKECYSNMVEKFSKRNEDLEKTVEELQLNLRTKNDLVEELTMKIEKMKGFLPSYIVNKYFKEDDDENN